MNRQEIMEKIQDVNGEVIQEVIDNVCEIVNDALNGYEDSINAIIDNMDSVRVYNFDMLNTIYDQLKDLSSDIY